MAQIIYRVSGLAEEDKRIRRDFRNTDDGRRDAQQFAATLADARTVYIVRGRVDGRVTTETFDRRKDADARAVTLEADKIQGRAIDPRHAKVTVAEFANKWLSERHDLAERTVELYRYHLDHHIIPRFGRTAIGSVTTSSVRSWHAGIAKDHPSSAAKSYRLLSTIMRTAVTDRLIAENPCRVENASTEKVTEREVATVAEVEALTEAMPERLRLAVLLAAYCQLRRAEVLGLRRRDVDLLRGTVTIAQTRTFTMKGRQVVKEPKTVAGRRTLAIPSNVDLEDHLERFTASDADARLFPVGNKVITRWWNRARASIGRPDLRFHDLRHTGLTWSAATGATTAELMHRAGHATAQAALRYQHATAERDRVLADALAELAPKAKVVPIRPRDNRATAGNPGA
jgi:integrase